VEVFLVRLDVNSIISCCSYKLTLHTAIQQDYWCFYWTAAKPNPWLRYMVPAC